MVKGKWKVVVAFASMQLEISVKVKKSFFIEIVLS